MNRINQLFSTKQKDILSIYFCAGFPTLEGTASTIKVLEKKGINMIEIGIPFSDPMADGPVIQHAATRALKNGMTLKLLFDQLKDIRREVQIPLVLMGYLNPIMQYGFNAFPLSNDSRAMATHSSIGLASSMACMAKEALISTQSVWALVALFSSTLLKIFDASSGVFPP